MSHFSILRKQFNFAYSERDDAEQRRLAEEMFHHAETCAEWLEFKYHPIWGCITHDHDKEVSKKILELAQTFDDWRRVYLFSDKISADGIDVKHLAFEKQLETARIVDDWVHLHYLKPKESREKILELAQTFDDWFTVYNEVYSSSPLSEIALERMCDFNPTFDQWNAVLQKDGDCSFVLGKMAEIAQSLSQWHCIYQNSAKNSRLKDEAFEQIAKRTSFVPES